MLSNRLTSRHLVGIAAVGCLVAVGMLVASCKTARLTEAGAQVAASPNPPVPGCQPLGSLTGKAGGDAGAYISEQDLTTYALNDLRNQAANLGANYVQHSPPAKEATGSTVTSISFAGTAYRCPAQSFSQPAQAQPPPPPPAPPPPTPAPPPPDALSAQPLPSGSAASSAVPGSSAAPPDAGSAAAPPDATAPETTVPVP